MDQITDAMEMVDHLSHPAFCVRDGIIIKANAAALGRMIEPGKPVAELLLAGAEEYRDFTSGCLYLTLRLCGQKLGFSVSRKKDFDLFQLEQDASNYELQAMSLAARELREPLASIMISTDQLFPKDQHDPGADPQLARINRGLYQMLRLISNMSDAARYASDIEPTMEIRNVTACLEEIFRKTAALVEASGCTLAYSSITEPIYAPVNTEMLERAVLNVISNALKFTPAGGQIQAKLSRQGSKLYLSITDNGNGIPGNLWGNLFSRYTREPGLEDGRFGIGLGLVIVHAAAAKHGGTVLIDQPGDTGTRVTMTLAIRPGSADTLRSPILRVDYAGERDHGLMELSDVLPADLYNPSKLN